MICAPPGARCWSAVRLFSAALHCSPPGVTPPFPDLPRAQHRGSLACIPVLRYLGFLRYQALGSPIQEPISRGAYL